MDSKHEEDVHNLDLGIGRSYECVFCKRGFNTAQALGGHMNIHRKDRARNKPIASSSSSTIFNYSNNSNNQVIHPHHFYNHRQQFMIHQIPTDPAYPVNPSHQAGFGYDQWSMGLIHHHRVEDDSEKIRRRRGRGGQEEQELDLELRL